MSEKDHSAWDTLDDLGLPPPGARGRPTAADRAGWRTDLVESPREPAALRAELHARRRAWIRGVGRLMSPGREAAARVLPYVAIAAMAMLGVVGLVMLIKGAPGGCGGFAVGLPLAGILAILADLRRQRLTFQVSSGHCPDCAFDLSGHPSALDPAIYGVEVGPRRCPECGAPWPLVPPPVPRKPTERRP